MGRPHSMLLTTRRLVMAISLLAVCQLFVIDAVAQSVAATLNGSVADANGAVIPGAKVTAMNPATGLHRETTTDDHGSFTFPLLPPSIYTISVEQNGFATAEVANVILNVGDEKHLQIQLKPGGVN